MARKNTIQVADLLAGADTPEAADREAQAFADAITDMYVATANDTADEDEGLSDEELREIGNARLADMLGKAGITPDNAAPPMTAKQKDRVIAAGSAGRGNRDTAGTPADADPSIAHAPKAPKTGICLFSGLPTGGGRFQPGGDAKLKSALIRRFRGEAVNVAGMSPTLAARFTDGDLATSEGALAYLIEMNWGHFATTKAQKQKVAADSRTPIEVLRASIESALRKYAVFDAEVDDVIESVMETVESFIPEADEDESAA